MVTRLAILGNLPLIGEVPPVATSGEAPSSGFDRAAPATGGDQVPSAGEPSSKEAAP